MSSAASGALAHPQGSASFPPRALASVAFRRRGRSVAAGARACPPLRPAITLTRNERRIGHQGRTPVWGRHIAIGADTETSADHHLLAPPLEVWGNISSIQSETRHRSQHRPATPAGRQAASVSKRKGLDLRARGGCVCRRIRTRDASITAAIISVQALRSTPTLPRSVFERRPVGPPLRGDPTTRRPPRRVNRRRPAVVVAPPRKVMRQPRLEPCCRIRRGGGTS